MKNILRYVGEKEAFRIKDNARKNGVTVIEWDGKDMPTKEVLLDMTYALFNFPEERHNNWDAWYDWMRDEYFFPKDSYALFVSNFDDFLVSEPDNRRIAIELLEDLPLWWQEEVVSCVVGGKAKAFNIYCVTDNV